MAFSEDPQATVQITLTLPVNRLRDLAQAAEDAVYSYSHGGEGAEIDLADMVLSPIGAALEAAARDHGC